MLVHQNHAAGGENGSIVAGIFVSLCLASKKPSEREFFVPAGTDLGVQLLIDPINLSRHKFIYIELYVLLKSGSPVGNNGG
jgi:hypothetical protein